jgi:hypothetical protein
MSSKFPVPNSTDQQIVCSISRPTNPFIYLLYIFTCYCVYLHKNVILSNLANTTKNMIFIYSVPRQCFDLKRVIINDALLKTTHDNQ